MTDIRKLITGTISRTGNPSAPMILADAHHAAGKLAKLMKPMADQAEVGKYAERLTGDLDAEGDTFAKDPSFIMALCAMLSVSIERWVNDPKGE